MNKYQSLLEIVANNPPTIRLRQPTTPPVAHGPAYYLNYDFVPDNGGELLALTPANLRALVRDWGAIFSNPHDASRWIQENGLFDPPSIGAAYASAHKLAAHCDANGNRGQRFNRMAALALMAHHVARQNGIIDGDIWAVFLRVVWLSRSFNLFFDISSAEISAMLDLMSERGAFYGNTITKTRADIPDTIRLYRGMAITGDISQGDFLGFSWSDDSTAATEYATRRKQQGMGKDVAIAATFKRDDIFTVIDYPKTVAKTLLDGPNAICREFVVRSSARPEQVEIAPLDFGIGDPFRPNRVRPISPHSGP